MIKSHPTKAGQTE